jgi:hypothetical protein
LIQDFPDVRCFVCAARLKSTSLNFVKSQSAAASHSDVSPERFSVARQQIWWRSATSQVTRKRSMKTNYKNLRSVGMGRSAESVPMTAAFLAPHAVAPESPQLVTSELAAVLSVIKSGRYYTLSLSITTAPARLMKADQSDGSRSDILRVNQ